MCSIMYFFLQYFFKFILCNTIRSVCLRVGLAFKQESLFFLCLKNTNHQMVIGAPFRLFIFKACLIISYASKHSQLTLVCIWNTCNIYFSIFKKHLHLLIVRTRNDNLSIPAAATIKNAAFEWVVSLKSSVLIQLSNSMSKSFEQYLL